ncbi:MAG TPA: hypothetical protein VJU59_06810 [Paraburkholderia sp.]|uniref:hypothetical protein n=1 Tax=Paraburkholderia sp. TaxID=1926495 RepID=UPI002B4938A1|nr:hypothetical protein [Paraburkholderia sp.]HKR39387.1 hypothetical protein [Paraburkholderia sp.]
MNTEPADTPLSETEVRERYANLQQRALHLGTRGQSRIDQLAAAMQLLPEKNADEYVSMLTATTDHAMVALLSYHRALPFPRDGEFPDRKPREAIPVC